MIFFEKGAYSKKKRMYFCGQTGICENYENNVVPVLSSVHITTNIFSYAMSYSHCFQACLNCRVVVLQNDNIKTGEIIGLEFSNIIDARTERRKLKLKW